VKFSYIVISLYIFATYIGLSMTTQDPLEPTDLALLEPRLTRTEKHAVGDGSPIAKPEGCGSSGSFGFQTR